MYCNTMLITECFYLSSLIFNDGELPPVYIKNEITGRGRPAHRTDAQARSTEPAGKLTATNNR